MILQNLSPTKWSTVVRQLWSTSSPVPLERSSLSQLAKNEAALPAFVRNCSVAMKYLRLLGDLDWDAQNHRYMSDLHDYLVEHPALVWVLGFELKLSDAYPWDFDVEAGCRAGGSPLASRVLRTLSNDALQFLLDGTVQLLADALPHDLPFGDSISQTLSRPAVSIPANTTGVAPPASWPPKSLSGANSSSLSSPSPSTEATSYFFPLMTATERRLGRRPPFGTLDAALDAFYVYEYFHTVRISEDDI